MILITHHTRVPPDPQVSLMIDESETFLDELDDLSRNPNAVQTHRNHSPQNLQNNNMPRLSTATEFDLTDLNPDFLDSSTGGNSNVVPPNDEVSLCF
jgi:hypothetical protein